MALRAWLVFNGVGMDIIRLGLLVLCAPSVAAGGPLNLADLFAGAGPEGAPLATDSFAARQIAWGFMLHGVVRAGAGLRGAADQTLVHGAAISYLFEGTMFLGELARGTATDPVPAVLTLGLFALTLAVLGRGKPVPVEVKKD